MRKREREKNSKCSRNFSSRRKNEQIHRNVEKMLERERERDGKIRGGINN